MRPKRPSSKALTALPASKQRPIVAPPPIQTQPVEQATSRTPSVSSPISLQSSPPPISLPILSSPISATLPEEQQEPMLQASQFYPMLQQQSVIQQLPNVSAAQMLTSAQIQPQRIVHSPTSQISRLMPVSSLDVRPKSPMNLMSMSIPSSVIERPSSDPPVKFTVGDDDIPSMPNSGSNSRTNSRLSSPMMKPMETVHQLPAAYSSLPAQPVTHSMRPKRPSSKALTALPASKQRPIVAPPSPPSIQTQPVGQATSRTPSVSSPISLQSSPPPISLPISPLISATLPEEQQEPMLQASQFYPMLQQQSVIQQPPNVSAAQMLSSVTSAQIQPWRIVHPPTSQISRLMTVSSVEVRPKSPMNLMSMSIPSSVIERPSLDPPVKFMVGDESDDDIPFAPNSGSNSRNNSRLSSPMMKPMETATSRTPNVSSPISLQSSPPPISLPILSSPISATLPEEQQEPMLQASQFYPMLQQQSVIQQLPNVSAAQMISSVTSAQIQPQRIAHSPTSQITRLMPVSSVDVRPKSPMNLMSMSIPSSVIERPSSDPPVKFMVGDDDIPSAPNSGSNSRTNSRLSSPMMKPMETGTSKQDAYRRRVKCAYCGKNFANNGQVQVHERIHTGEKPFRCGVCTKVFTQESHLKRHKRIHTGEKPFRCSVCTKVFTQESHLKRHKIIHTGEKIYTCNLCKKNFHRKDGLTEHERTHTGENPYKCNICNKTFKSKSNLTRHQRLHTGANK
ncbi:uncharacterized protein [Amphiura filiformis]|uniref:uncharacterized protein n=1 Tax=Amphiura filiformis TaxID=82378 RepID=UPI003B21FCE4